MEKIAPDYVTARARFLVAAREAGAELKSILHPLAGPLDEELRIDLSWLGPIDAKSVVLVMSATHGVEGFAGSALQSRWLRDNAADLPEDVAVLCLHALNPFGFAWTRRVNEDNVDLNRNYIDFDAGLPVNAEYEDLADLLVPSDWSEQSQTESTGALLKIIEDKGFEWFQQAASGGQYAFPKGIFYGGSERTWSNQRMQQICEQHLSTAERVAIIDLHTGLGPWGHGDLLTHETAGSEGYIRLNDWYDGDVNSVSDGSSVSAAITGEGLALIPEWMPQAEVTSMAIEYGVIDIISVMQALRSDAWLWAHGDPKGEDAPAINTALRAAFADDDPAWFAKLWEQFALRFDQAVSGITR